MSEAKQRSEQHLIDADGERLLRRQLPRYWVLREYRPDYGLDFALEVFQQPNGSATGHATYETLGEHIFIQLKSISTTTSLPLKLYSRHNVEKGREVLDKNDLIGELNTIRFSLETSELVTIERMGVAIPVLLVIADLTAERCYFVCMNDYIDKILIPRHDDYTAKNSRTIHVPTRNEIGDEVVGLTALRWYAKRAKLYGAFQRFIFQAAELTYAFGSTDFLPMAHYFAIRIANYDFWEDTEMWALISRHGEEVKRLVETGRTDLSKAKPEEILELWRRLTILPRNYEDVCREWFLPTPLGYLSS